MPMISVDEYESKTGGNEEVIVVAYYAIEEDAAKDLDDFIEKSSIDILDVDVSPNPTEDGHYMVFVELKRAPDFFQKLYGITEEVENLAGKMDWMVTTRSAENEIPLGDEQLETSVYVADMTPVMTDDDEDNSPDMAEEQDSEGEDMEDMDYDEVEEAMSLFNTNSMIAEAVDGKIKLSGIYMDVMDCDTETVISEAYDHIPMDFTESYECKILKKALGLDWEIINLRECVALKHNVSGNVVIVRV